MQAQTFIFSDKVMKFLKRFVKEDDSKLDEVEKGIANKWRWEWLEKIVDIDPLSIHPIGLIKLLIYF